MLHILKNTSDSISIFNLGTGDTCSVSRISEIVVEESKLSEVSIEYSGGKRGWAGDVPKTYLNVDKLLATGFLPTSNSEEAVRNTASSLIKEIGLF